MHIRRAQPSDYNRILVLWEDARQTMLAAGNLQWQGAYPGAEEAREDIAAGDAYLLEIDGEAVGIMAVNGAMPTEYATLAWQTTGPAYTIHRLGVHSSLQRRGYAATMLAHAETIAREQGAACIHIDTYSPNLRAQQLFEQLGYRRVGPFEMKQKPLPYIAFEKQL